MPWKKQITDKQMLDIYQRHLKGESQVDLAQEFGISQPAISKRLKEYTPPVIESYSRIISPPQETNKVNLIDLRWILKFLTGKDPKLNIPDTRDRIIAILQRIDDKGNLT